MRVICKKDRREMNAKKTKTATKNMRTPLTDCNSRA